MENNGRLCRSLYLVPSVLARQGILIAELARELDIDEATLREDIELCPWSVRRPGPRRIPLLITVDDDDGCVYADLPQGLTRPLR